MSVYDKPVEFPLTLADAIVLNMCLQKVHDMIVAHEYELEYMGDDTGTVKDVEQIAAMKDRLTGIIEKEWVPPNAES